jgi:serpin B
MMPAAILTQGDAASQPEQPAPPPLAQSQARLSYKLINKISETNKGTIVLSPASLAGALSTVEFGTLPPLKQSIVEILNGYQKDGGDANLQRLRTALKTVEGSGPLSIANALLLEPGDVKDDGHALADVQKAGVEVLREPLSGTELLQRVNSWVDEKTAHKIPTLLEEPLSEAGLISLNALYFKDKWLRPFDPAATSDGPFTLVGGGTANASFMHSPENYFLFRTNDRFIAVDLPFATQGYALTLVTTKEGAAPADAFANASSWLTGAEFKAKRGSVTLPKLTFSTAQNLKPVLTALGLKDEPVAGFTKTPVRIAATHQRVEFKIDEEGAEAAAATAIVGTRGIENEALAFIGDRPFLFALRDKKTGLILASGYVAQP